MIGILILSYITLVDSKLRRDLKNLLHWESFYVYKRTIAFSFLEGPFIDP